MDTMKFLTKPVPVEAVRFDGNNHAAIRKFVTGAGSYDADFIYIPTLEGMMKASSGDWVIKDAKAVFSICKPDAFEAIYEPA